MKQAKDFFYRMNTNEAINWYAGNAITKTEIAINYLQSDEFITIDSLGSNIESNLLELNLEKVKRVLPKEFKAILYPQSQRTEQYRRLILARN